MRQSTYKTTAEVLQGAEECLPLLHAVFSSCHAEVHTMNDPPILQPTQPPGPPANCDSAGVTHPGPVTARESRSANGEDHADQNEAALVDKVRCLLSSGQPWPEVAKAAGLPPSVAALWLQQNPDALPQTWSKGEMFELPWGETLVYLEGRRRCFKPETHRVLVFLLARPRSTLAEMVSRLRLSGPSSGYKALNKLNTALRTLDPPLAAPFCFRLRHGAVERVAFARKPLSQPGVIPAAAIPLREAVQKFLAHLRTRGCSPHTVQAYGADLRRYESWACRAEGPPDPLAPSIDQLEAFLSALVQCGLSASTRQRCTTTLRSFSRWLVSKGLPATMANAELLGTVKGEEKVPGTLTVEQVERLLAEPDPSERLYHRNRAVLELLYSLGGRASELADLCVEDVDLAQCRCVLNGKGGKRRVAFLTPRALAALQSYLTESRHFLAQRSRNGPPPWLILSHRGRRLSRESIFGIVRTYVWRAGLPKKAAHPHAIRHSFATALLANGANIVNVRDLLGHESVASTQRYTHVSTQDLLAAHARFHPLGDPTIPSKEKAS
jgi:integrase/recombinase XerD